MAEVPIIRICSLGFIALVAAGLASAPALAVRGDNALALNRFVEARLAESSDELIAAAALYAESLKAQPDNILLAGKAYVNAVEVGDFALALKAVETVRLRGQIEPEMPLLPFAEAFAQRDWKRAGLAIDELDALENFSFMEPFLQAWVATARGRSGYAALTRAKTSTTGRYYLEEQLILYFLANGQEESALGLLNALVQRKESRMGPVRILAARHFWAKNASETARALLQSPTSGPELRLLQQIEAGQKRGVAQKVDAAIGLAFLFQRLSNDLAVQRAHFPAQVMAQVGTRLAGASDYAHLTRARAYASAENNKLAALEFSKIGDHSPYYLTALSSEVSLLVASAEYDKAMARLERAIDSNAEAPELHILKGQALQARNQHAAAAGSFETAIVLAENLQRSDALLANYWLALGGAQEQAGLWPEGLQSLQKANALAPDSPAILNYLGYAQLERRENKEAAVAAIKRAHELRSTSPAITDSLGWAYFVTGEHERAVGYLETALQGQPQDPIINEHLGDAYWSVGREFEARYAWQSAKLFAEEADEQRLASKIDLGLRPDLIAP